VVNLVELRFLSEHYHVAPERIIEMRGHDRDFVAIHADVRGGGGRKYENSQGQNSPGKGRGKGRGKKD
jgi:hypothetical protein